MLQNFIVVFADLTGGEIGLTIPDVISIDAGVNYWIALGFMTISAIILYGLSQIADRPRAAGQRTGSGAGRRARLQHRQAQARRLHRQRLLLGTLGRALGVLLRHSLSGYGCRRRGRGQRHRCRGAGWPPHGAGRSTRRDLPDRGRRIPAADRRTSDLIVSAVALLVVLFFPAAFSERPCRARRARDGRDNDQTARARSPRPRETLRRPHRREEPQPRSARRRDFRPDRAQWFRANRPR